MAEVDQATKDRLNRAGRMGGVYLESIGKFDLRTLSDQEWTDFLYSVCEEYCIPF